MTQDTQKKHKKARREATLFLVVVAASLVLLNVLGTFAHARVDLTESRMFSLSQGSKDMSKRLKDTLEIRSYFTPDLPYPYNGLERYTRDMLEEYEASSNGKIQVRYINPSDDAEKEAAQADGVQQVPTLDLTEDRIEQVQAFRGLSFHYLGESKAIPFLENTEGLEYQITQIIKELIGEKLRIGILKGHDGPSLEKGLTGLRDLTRSSYDVEEVDANQDLPKNLKALIVVNPQTSLSQAETANIAGFLQRGGSLGVFGGTRKLPDSLLEGTASIVDSGFNKLLSDWGVTMLPDLVADAECGSVNAPTNIPGLAIPVRYPLLPEVRIDDKQAEHPVLFKLGQLQMPFTTRLKLGKVPAGIKRAVLAKSSENSWLLTDAEAQLTPRQQWAPSNPMGPFPLIVAIEGSKSGSNGPMSTAETGDKEPPSETPASARILVAGSGFVLDDRALPPPNPRTGERQMTSTMAFALNAIDWLAQDAAMVAIRAKDVEEPPLKDPALEVLEDAKQDVEQARKEGDAKKAEAALDLSKEKLADARARWNTTKSLYRWMHTLGLPIAFALLGLLYWRRRKNHNANLKL
ncbi:MAG: GldG family protein [Myxococcales bacterium]|nr:GldG family protein [Myxococcales bacterium]MCB9708965.1 GldG family protein [Myxococcales bacterium]